MHRVVRSLWLYSILRHKAITLIDLGTQQTQGVHLIFSFNIKFKSARESALESQSQLTISETQIGESM